MCKCTVKLDTTKYAAQKLAAQCFHPANPLRGEVYPSTKGYGMEILLSPQRHCSDVHLGPQSSAAALAKLSAHPM